MGNNLNSKPQVYSDQWHYGQDTRVYGGSVGGSYMASYRQNSATADSMQFGSGKMQFGAKMLQDTDPGPKHGEMYVLNNANKRLYFTYKGQVAPWASDVIKQAKNYGVGPCVSITGSPLNPVYHMFYAPGGSDHKSDDWQPILINSKADVMEALTSGMGGVDKGVSSTSQFANHYGQSSINPFGATVGGDMWTGADRFGSAITSIGSKLIIPIGESLLNDVIPGASFVMDKTGLSAAMQVGVDALVKGTQGKTYQSSGQFDPQIANSIKDPRLPGYLTSLEDQSHQFIAKYGDSKYQYTQKLSQDTRSQMLTKAKQLAQENEDAYVHSQVQEITNLSTKLQELLKGKTDSEVFQNIKTGLELAQTNQQKMNVINHFGNTIKNELLPLLKSSSVSSDATPDSQPKTQQSAQLPTARAQVNHPSLSINGHDSRLPTQHVISGNPEGIIPIGPF